jgi:hypothetical protein
MGGWKKHQPGCPCCAGPCTTTIHVTACCVAANGATVTVKTAGGTTVATGTTNSSGDASVVLTGYVGQTLYAFVSYSTANYLPYTGVLMGNFCGRTYNYDLQPASDTFCNTCGTITITTTQCDGTTLLGGKAWTLQKASAGGFTTYATGTTDATTAKSTITGLTYGGAFDGYRFLATDATGGVTGTSILLTSTNCAAKCLMRMSTSSRFPCTTPQDAITYSGSGSQFTNQRGCAPYCAPVTIPGNLTLYDPQAMPGISAGDVPAQADYYPAYRAFGSCGGAPFTFAPCDLYSIGFGTLYSDGFQINTAGTNNAGCYPYWDLPIYNYSASVYNGDYVILARYRMSFTSSGPQLQVGRIHGAFYDSSHSCNNSNDSSASVLGMQFGTLLTAIAASVTCSPFSATFNLPSYTVPLYHFGWPAYLDGSYTFPARTITVHA